MSKLTDTVVYLQKLVEKHLGVRTTEGNYCHGGYCPICKADGIDRVEHSQDCYWFVS